MNIFRWRIPFDPSWCIGRDGRLRERHEWIDPSFQMRYNACRHCSTKV